ncbi:MULTISPECIES: hypothetical protein [Olivibacter]|uniref:Uncharacterized protein n=1 Tax=Olivibacter jilunii TaxID=985016 RepID=A0ABW6B026_9SPHI
MIQIKTLEGKPFDLLDESVTIELNNSLFNSSEILRGSSSFPISMANTDNNLMLIKFATNLSSTPKSAEIPVLANISGQNFRKAMLSVNLADGKLEGVLILDLGIINDKLKNTRLNELPFDMFTLGVDDSEDMSIDANAMKAAAMNTDWRQIPYTFAPILAPDFSGNPTNPTDFSPTRPPFKRLFNISVPFVNLFSLNEAETQAAFKTPDQPVWYKEEGGTYNITYVSFGYQVVPQFYLMYVLDVISKTLGYTAKGECLSDKDFSRLVIDNNVPLISRRRWGGLDDAILNLKGGEDNYVRFTAANHLPKISIADFFKKLTAVGIHISLDETQSTINFNWKKTSLANRSARDWSNKLSKIVQTEYNDIDGLQFKMETDIIDSLGIKSKKTETVTIGNGGKDEKVDFGTLSTVVNAFPKDGFVWAQDQAETWPYESSKTQDLVLPYKDSKAMIYDRRFPYLGNYKSYTDSDSSTDLILLFYNGMQSYNDSVLYPQLSNESATFSLYLSGEKGLFNTKLKDWYNRVFACKEIKARFNLDITDINTLKESDQILIKDDNNTVVKCLFKKIKFDTGKPGDDKLLAEVDLVAMDTQVLADSIDSRVVMKYEYVKTFDGPSQKRWDVVISFWADRNYSKPVQVSDVIVKYIWQRNFLTRGQKSEIKTNYSMLVNGHSVTLSNFVFIDSRFDGTSYSREQLTFIDTNQYRIIDHPTDSLDLV